ncbi:MAG TPA: MFS transporter [Polyangiaceae bacterium]|nr:MFS transporter [Polyangiaceae bacterium]
MNDQFVPRGLFDSRGARHDADVSELCLQPPPACEDGGGPALPRRASLLAVLSLSFACVALDNTKLALSVPTLARELGTGSPEQALLLRWTIEANLIVYASLLLLGGALSERLGARRLLLAGLTLFASGSVLGAAAGSLGGLCAGRAVVGLGAALLVPASLAAVEHVFGGAGRERAIAIWTASFGAAAALGPVLGGWLLERWGWRASLLGNVPLLLIAIAGVYERVPATLPRRTAPIDGLGAALGFVATLCLIAALLGGVAGGTLAVFLCAAAGGYALLVFWQRRARYPMLAPELFRRSAFRCTLLTILLAYLAFSGLSFAVVQHLQLVRAHAPGVASLLNLPLPLAMLAGTLLAPRLMRAAGARALGWSLCVSLVGAVSIGVACVLQNDLALCLALVPFAAGAGSAFVNATGRVLAAAAADRAGSAAAISESAFELGGVLGVGLLGTRLGALPGVQGSSAAALGAAVALTIALGLSRRASHFGTLGAGADGVR